MRALNISRSSSKLLHFRYLTSRGKYDIHVHCYFFIGYYAAQKNRFHKTIFIQAYAIYGAYKMSLQRGKMSRKANGL